MLEPIFTARNNAARQHVAEGDPDSYELARCAALLHRAINLAIESAFRFGRDLPVGAVAANDEWITGRYFASDTRLGWPVMHAEILALIDSEYNRAICRPDTVVVTIEPCENCQDTIARDWQGIKRVGFGLSREEVAARGLVKPHDEDIFERVKRLGLPYEVFQVEDDQLRKAGGLILDYASRDTGSGTVSVDRDGLNEALIALNVLG